ncbi:hypothetical protein COEREDRAFT_83884 [Coemansia reversa NRRL 1564]|uniref:PWI domain-containing protein n=1 Tax=Coemansia reversa (strain ATCC 12441 / NRRL 1564) TaxID=763665 RepID=A0A2G5B1D2_COERN|nr:hypothetical protein COEREDRAFT_83884 [Coemansia reversa NRRL 1564]|eukprot:PIA12828.1 hypothetical protein COEREDRAFT_83884 [Coemansia reversa NRRL 1564]
MSSYQPPPLENHATPRALSYGGSSGSRGGFKRPSRGEQLAAFIPPRSSLMNPFGSPEISTAPSTGDMVTGLDARQWPLKDQSVMAFVSGVDSSIDDKWMERILEACGDVCSWERVCSADGKPQSFGFCEFRNLDGAARALHVLSRSGGMKDGGWTLCPSRLARKAQELHIQVDVSIKEGLDAYHTPLERSPRGNQITEKDAYEAVERIICELEEAMHDSSALRDTKRRSSSLGDASSASEVGRGGSLGEDVSDFSLESELAWEKECTNAHRHKRHVLAVDERGRRLARELETREEQIERSSVRELDEIEERQKQREAMLSTLLKWNDEKEERVRDHLYYRDRERWWRSRKFVREREMELDDAEDGQKQDEQAAVIEDSSGSPDRRALIKSLIQEIPTDPEALFEWPVKWEHVDLALVQSKIEPAVRRRLREYLGCDDEDGSVSELTNYVSAHIRAQKPPLLLEDELGMVLVDEAREFVARIWRFVVYESEARARNVA